MECMKMESGVKKLLFYTENEALVSVSDDLEVRLKDEDVLFASTLVGALALTLNKKKTPKLQVLTN